MRGFGDLEAVVIDRLWSWRRSATVREVFDDLQKHRKIAYTTVMTVMDNLHTKGWLRAPSTAAPIGTSRSRRASSTAPG